MNNDRLAKWLPFILTTISYIVAAIQYYLRDIDSLPHVYAQTFTTCLMLSLLISISLLFIRSNLATVLFLLLRQILIFIVSYPIQNLLGIELILYLGLLCESSFRTSFTNTIPLSSFLILFGIASQKIRFSYVGITGSIEHINTSASDILIIGLYLCISAIIFIYLKYLLAQNAKQAEINHHLNIGIESLIKANLTFQQYAYRAEIIAAQKERERIVREIHDASGYYFTNLIALMEVAISLGIRDKEKLTELQYQAKAQAQEGLQETRKALRLLRITSDNYPRGIKAILLILKTFEQVTDTKIVLHLGNMQWTYSDEIDLIVYRIVQEALTNSFRHGHASTIWISFWEHNGILIINIHDNGSGAEKIEKGIGLKGMEERLSQHGGTLEIVGKKDQFQLLIRLPISKSIG